jgi:hypothetical protein
MTIFIEEDIEDMISADDWSGVVICPRERIRLEIEQKIAEFQKNSGKITVVPAGASAAQSIPFGTNLVTNKSNNFTQSELKAYAKRKAGKLHYQVRNGDAEAVALLQTLLDTAPHTTFLAKELKCSPDRVWRLLRENFADDPCADKFHKRERDVQKLDNELALVAKIREALAAGMVGTWPICKYCHSSFVAVTAASKKYKLGIPRGKGGRPAKEGGL